jgi:hypothetical protein
MACGTSDDQSDEDCVVMPWKGRDGVWWETNLALQLHSEALRAPKLDEALKKADELLAARDAQLKAVSAALVYAKDSANHWEVLSMEYAGKANENAVKAMEAKEASEAWYRSPILWYVLGVGTAAATVAVAVAVVKEAW